VTLPSTPFDGASTHRPQHQPNQGATSEPVLKIQFRIVCWLSFRIAATSATVSYVSSGIVRKATGPIVRGLPRRVVARDQQNSSPIGCRLLSSANDPILPPTIRSPRRSSTRPPSTSTHSSAVVRLLPRAKPLRQPSTARL
jgi:hypothetical protein